MAAGALPGRCGGAVTWLSLSDVETDGVGSSCHTGGVAARTGALGLDGVADRFTGMAGGDDEAVDANAPVAGLSLSGGVGGGGETGAEAQGAGFLVVVDFGGEP